ncbi:protein of unknown function DUF3850 [Erwinia phage Midgardsormr38]|uniref:DUF3850 domain-containing protein n=1 Tax=Erwinia phage Midgardsormr38 TaxID=2663326 RepID=A0A5Q2FAR9_9CAUD|nr:protein of unknown function DUF3850 [Erwinia phage Midgardsormr38]QGF22025.1 protein of unknown function DUF3850 [Erwinia phage Midgardsormr38]
MATHELKIHPQHFVPVFLKVKTAELRNNDRDFKCGDTLVLREWLDGYTGRSTVRKVNHVADVSDYLPGYVLLSIEAS